MLLSRDVFICIGNSDMLSTEECSLCWHTTCCIITLCSLTVDACLHRFAMNFIPRAYDMVGGVLLLPVFACCFDPVCEVTCAILSDHYWSQASGLGRRRNGACSSPRSSHEEEQRDGHVLSSNSKLAKFLVDSTHPTQSSSSCFSLLDHLLDGCCLGRIKCWTRCLHMT